MSYQSVIDSFNVTTNSKYQPAADGTTYCNVFAQDVMKALNTPLPSDNCQTMLNALRSGYSKWEKVSAVQAQNNANAGKSTVGITYDHIVVVYPGHTATSVDEGYMSRAGYKCFNNTRITYAWTRDRLSEVEFYTYMDTPVYDYNNYNPAIRATVTMTGRTRRATKLYKTATGTDSFKSLNANDWVDIIGESGDRYQMFIPDGTVCYVAKADVSPDNPDIWFYSDTTMDMSIKKGNTYQILIECATTITNFYLGSSGAFSTSMKKQGARHCLTRFGANKAYGDTYFCRLTAIGSVGQSAGVYVSYACKNRNLFTATFS